MSRARDLADGADKDIAGTLTLDDIVLSNDMSVADDGKVQFGAGNDLQLYHDGSASYVSEQGTGNLNILGTSIDFLNSAANKYYLAMSDGGSLTLYHNGGSKLTTTSTGVDVTGVITTDGMTTSADINFGDNDKAIFGAGSDLEIFHDGSNSNISDVGTGQLVLRTDGTQVAINKGSSENMAKFITDGAVELYHDNSKKFETTSTGVDVTGVITTDGMTTSADINFGDNDKAQFGAGNDLQIYHDGSHSYIKDNGTGSLLIQGSTAVVIEDPSGNNMAFFEDGGEAILYHNAGARLTTKAAGVDVTGSVTADGLTVDSTGGATPTYSHTNNGEGLTLRYNDDSGARAADIVATGNNPAGATTAMRFFVNPNSTDAASEVMRLQNGRVGIGTNSPARQLDVYDDGTNSQAVIAITAQNTDNSRIMFADTDDNNIGIINYSHSQDSMSFVVNNAERMRVDSSGQVMIGTTSAGGQFTVTDSDATTIIDRVGTNVAGIKTGSGDDFCVGTADFAQAIRIKNNSGHVGVGTTAPSVLFHAENGDNEHAAFIHNTNSSFSSNTLQVSTSRNTTNSSYNHFTCSIHGIANKMAVRDSGAIVSTNNSIGSISDQRMKENIIDAASQWDDIKAVQVRKYNRIGETQKELGGTTDRTGERIMFGELALSERAIAAQGILSFGGASMIGTFSKVSVASGVLVGIIEASANFTQDTDAIFIASADVVKSFNFTQDTAANRVKPAVASAISDFTQSTTGTFIGTGISTLDANFTQSSAGITIASGISEQSFNFTQVSTATLIAHGLIEASAQFDQTTVGIAIRTGSATMDFAFDQTTVATLVATGAAEIIAIFVSTANGEILWERIDPGGSPNWLDITHTGDTWTEITVGGTTETWTETVV
jgi:hypothetical protein